ncbi:serine/threonine protein kinase [Streptomyces rubiginosohelvolus]|uniref:serine/threonine protein kinase n=1 Tax=Streptomyces rubiginosohelvolus TaxID=67362 RepID=UPI003F4C18B8
MPLNTEDPESIGGYQLEDRLGSGGMGIVYQGQSGSGRKVAVKVVYQQFADDVEFRARFRREVTAARRVSGAFTAAVVDADPDAAQPWMATSYVPGPTLTQRVVGNGPLDSKELRNLAVGLVEALRDIHRVGVVHRDLKPSNVILSEDGPRVIDFGISHASDQQHLTATGQVMGTPPFMSPEQFLVPKDVGPETDIFSLASVLVYAASGHSPFEAENAYMTAYHVVHDPPRLGNLSETLQGILTDCLEKDPSKRLALDELLERLRNLPADNLLPLNSVFGAPAPYPVRRRRRIVAGAFAVAAGTGVAAALAFGLLDSAQGGPDGKPSQASPSADSTVAPDPRFKVAPAGVTGSSSYPGHGPSLAFDGLKETWWGPGLSGTGSGEWIEARFIEPIRLTDLVFTSGPNSRATPGTGTSLPHRVAVTITTAAARTVKRELNLDAVLTDQHRTFNADDVTSVRFTVVSSYNASEDTQVAINEIGFFNETDPPARR